MKNNILAYLKQEKPATGGLLFMTVALIIVAMFIFTVTTSRVTMSRSVAESVEHVIAMECLASCYIHPNQSAVHGQKEIEWNDVGKSFSFQQLSAKKGSTPITPVKDFNTIMQKLKLMRDASAKEGETPESQSAHMYYKYYTKDDPTEGYKAGQAIFDLQMQEYSNYDTFWTQIWKIRPNNVRVTIENSYSGSESDF